MKYKIGDRVRLKYEYFTDSDLRHALDALPNRVATIEKVNPGSDGYENEYLMEEICWIWEDDEIECLVEEKKVEVKVKVEEVSEPVKNRYQILDLSKDEPMKKNTSQMTKNERLKECTLLVLCKDELFFQIKGGETIATWYPVGKAAASVCSLHFGIPLSYDGGPDIDNEEMINEALSGDDYVG